MPLLKIQTNQTITDSSDLLAELSKKVSSMLGKPENYVMIMVEDKISMCFAGNTDPAIFAELKSINFPEDKTPEFSAEICSLLSRSLKVSQDRIYIEFSNASRSMWGWNGRTF